MLTPIKVLRRFRSIHSLRTQGCLHLRVHHRYVLIIGPQSTSVCRRQVHSVKFALLNAHSYPLHLYPKRISLHISKLTHITHNDNRMQYIIRCIKCIMHNIGIVVAHCQVKTVMVFARNVAYVLCSISTSLCRRGSRFELSATH